MDFYKSFEQSFLTFDDPQAITKQLTALVKR